MRLVARAQRVVSRFGAESRCDRRILPWNGESKPRQRIRRPLLWPYPRPVLLRVPANPTLKHGAKRCRRIRGERQVVVVGLLLQASNHADSSGLIESLPSPNSQCKHSSCQHRWFAMDSDSSMPFIAPDRDYETAVQAWRVTSSMHSIAVSHRRVTRAGGMAGAGISTTTSPSGRMMTPRRRAARVTW